MANEDLTYADRLTALQNKVLEFLRTFESIQEELRPGVLAESQARLVSVVRDTFRRFESSFVPLTPPAATKELHQPLCAAIRELGKAYEIFMSKPGPEWTLAFLHSRAAFCRGLYQLYELRDQLPLVAPHFLTVGAKAPAPGAPGGPSTGFIQRQRNTDRSDYTLYVPEDYLQEKPIPLIVALHGGYGQGYEYVWTWLRAARSRGYAVLAPKSLGDTWDMMVPSSDTRSVVRMISEVVSEYSIDPARVYLTGLSDGGIFTYILGLEQPQLFRGLAPIAGALHLTVDPMLRQGRGKDTPMLVVHGVHDFIFPVAYTRQTCNLLKSIGYNVTYEELPEWGHAYPYSINERLVLPWFESLPAK
ncbi:MAG: PHB depolymerase family esterase [Candidatus Binatus sp.]|uniref:carboxylesterase family protein n=1 Tax=Candidatus Binatus sp. TaxID=2811406 RepID=UPI0027240E46|nr:PHB depolymerase family esterase [Candidatus Binatus sp.]MDO8433744.1 PHB depolymerase family esterase [Candidatus Binatus sp.]